jgi:diguanylate cyclase (GGDEF)-like protein
MDASTQGAVPQASPSGDSRWLTATVAMLATVLFVVSGSQVMPYVLSGNSGGPAPELVSGFLLNIALLLFAWRRSVQLRESLARQRGADLTIRHLAYFDEVTGLYNRRHLHVFAGELLVSGEKDVALLLIDLDQFKAVNDLHGHEVGDAVLISTAEKIRTCCAPEDCCVRLGGDEFVVLLHGLRARGKQPRLLADKLVDALQIPICAGDTVVSVGASIGIARLQGVSRELRWLLRRADLAMYEAKAAGKNRWVEFDEAMEIELGKQAALEAEIRHGIQAGEFVPYFQPIYELASGEVKGFEALARWQHPAKGLLEPAEFLSVAESSGLIGEISLSIMHQTLLAAKDWPAHLKIAVNMSAVQFKDPLLAQRLLRLLTQINFPAGRLELEIPEDCLISGSQHALANIQSLQAQGISIVIDDFGTRYASLTHLKSLPFDRIKIDHSFVKLLDSDQQCEALVEAIATLGKGLSIPMAAEGIETAAIKERLGALGCADAQGWLYATALSPEDVNRMFAAPPAADDDHPVSRAG